MSRAKFKIRINYSIFHSWGAFLALFQILKKKREEKYCSFVSWTHYYYTTSDDNVNLVNLYHFLEFQKFTNYCTQICLLLLRTSTKWGKRSRRKNQRNVKNKKKKELYRLISSWKQKTKRRIQAISVFSPVTLTCIVIKLLHYSIITIIKLIKILGFTVYNAGTRWWMITRNIGTWIWIFYGVQFLACGICQRQA